MHQKSPFGDLKSKKISGEGALPLPQWGGRHPLTTSTAFETQMYLEGRATPHPIGDYGVSTLARLRRSTSALRSGKGDTPSPQTTHLGASTLAPAVLNLGPRCSTPPLLFTPPVQRVRGLKITLLMMHVACVRHCKLDYVITTRLRGTGYMVPTIFEVLL